MVKFINISELTKMLNFIDHKTKKPLNHILRYWEKEFKQIKPKKINNRRYYSIKQVEIIKLIKFLLRDQGMTISGAKKILDLKINKLDENNSIGLKAGYLKLKSRIILKKLNILKKYGKKNSH